MPNICLYEMKAVGKKENVDKLVEIMNNDYNATHMWRIFSADTNIISEPTDNPYSIIIYGDCAWSVYSCMFDGPHTYQNANKNHDKNGTDIITLSKELQLDIEIFSEESGMCFAEHYMIIKGNLEIDESTDFIEYYDEETDTYTTQGGYRFSDGKCHFNI